MAPFMLRQSTSALLAALLLPVGVRAADEPSSAPARNQPAGRDLYGDPLPPGARFRLGTVRFRHANAIRFVGFSADGKRLVSAGNDGYIRVWETASGKELHRISLPASGFGGGGSGTSDGTFTLSHRYRTHGTAKVSLAPDGETLAVLASNGTVTLWNTSTGKELRSFRINGNSAGNLVFSPDGKKLAVKNRDAGPRLFDTTTGKELRQLGKEGQKRRFDFNDHGIAFTPDGMALASFDLVREQPGGFMGGVTLWDAETGKELRKIKVGENLFAASIAFAPDGKTLGLAVTDGSIRLFDVKTAKELHKLAQDQQFNRSPNLPLFSPDGKTVAVKHGRNATVHLWDVATGKELRKLGDGYNSLTAAQALNHSFGGEAALDAAFSRDGKVLALGTGLGAIQLFDVATGKEMTPVGGHPGPVDAIFVSADGRHLSTVAGDETLRQWEAVSGKEARRLRLPVGAGYPIFAPDGRTVAFGTADDKIRLWDVAAGKELHAFAIPGVNFVPLPAGACGLAFAPDSKSVIAKDLHGTVHRWDVATGKETSQFTTRAAGNRASVTFNNGACPGIVVAPDGRTVAAVGSSTGNSRSDVGDLRLWDLATGRQVRTFSSREGDIRVARFSPDGRNLACIYEGRTVLLGETLTGKERCRFPVKDSKAISCSLAFSPDGRILATGAENGSIYFWDIYTTKKLGEFIGHQGTVRSLTFSADGKTLYSGGADTTVLAWNMADRIQPEALATVEVNDEQLAALGSDLGDDSAAKAYQAFGSLIRAPKQATAFLKPRIKPAVDVEPGQLAKLIRKLESNKFAERQQANAELERLGELAEPHLKNLLQGKPTLETRQRAERLLQRLVTGQPPPAAVLQTLRAVEVLEAVNTPEARELLQTLAQGAAGAKLTEAARQSLARLRSSK